MSTVSFPESDHASTSSLHDPPFFPPSFDSSLTFQMNPLSAHPPRTPRPSNASTTAQSFASVVYESHEVELDKPMLTLEEADEPEETVVESKPQVNREEVWRDIVSSSNGRDKAFKLIQYTIRLSLFFHTTIRTSNLIRFASPSWEDSLVGRLSSTMKGLSNTRKLLLLFNWLGPLAAITSRKAVPYSTERTTEVTKGSHQPFIYSLLYAPPPLLLELVNAVSDDAYALSLIGLLSKKSGDRAGRFSDWCWFLSTIVGLIENSVENGIIGQQRREVESRAYAESMTGATAKSTPRNSKIDEHELARLRRESFWLQVSRAKLIMDLIFVSYDLFHIKYAKELVKATTGLASAMLSSAKLYDRHKAALAKAAA